MIFCAWRRRERRRNSNLQSRKSLNRENLLNKHHPKSILESNRDVLPVLIVNNPICWIKKQPNNLGDVLRKPTSGYLCGEQGKPATERKETRTERKLNRLMTFPIEVGRLNQIFSNYEGTFHIFKSITARIDRIPLSINVTQLLQSLVITFQKRRTFEFAS